MGTVNIIAADLRDAAEAERAVDAVERDFGAVDVLVNSAGAAKRTPADELTADAWHDAMQAKFFTYIHVTNPLIKRMGERGDGAVVNFIGSGGKVAAVTHLAGGAANAALVLASPELAAAYAGKRRARKRRQSWPHAHRAPARRHASRSATTRHQY